MRKKSTDSSRLKFRSGAVGEACHAQHLLENAPKASDGNIHFHLIHRSPHTNDRANLEMHSCGNKSRDGAVCVYK